MDAGFAGSGAGFFPLRNRILATVGDLRQTVPTVRGSKHEFHAHRRRRRLRISSDR